MRKYQFTLQCFSRGTIRVADTVKFVRLTQDAFGRSGWTDSDGHVVELAEGPMERAIRGGDASTKIARFGATWVAKSTGSAIPIVVTVTTGGDQWALNDFTVNFSRTQELPEISYFRHAIELVRPFEAMVLDLDNDDHLRTAGVVTPRMAPHGSRVASLRWLHYLDRGLAEKVGGLPRCLATPAYRVEPFCDGVLIQLTPEPFDAQNQDHCAAQRRAMQFLGIGEWQKSANGPK